MDVGEPKALLKSSKGAFFELMKHSVTMMREKRMMMMKKRTMRKR